MNILLYRIVKWALLVFISWLYLICFKWNVFFGIFSVVLFAYCASGVVTLLIHFFVFLFSRPRILKENEQILREGIPPYVKVVFFRPIFATTTAEMASLLENMRRDILNTKEDNRRNFKFVVIDNNRDVVVREWTRREIKNLQMEFGTDTVFYFHRNKRSDFFKKVGIYHDAIMLLYEGWSRPRIYTDKRWEPWTGERRNPNLAIWDEILGDIKALGLEAEIGDILQGKDIKVSEASRIKISVICDADNFWPKAEIKKIVAKILHPQNKDFIIWQPSIEISNPYENRFIRLSCWARRMYEFDMIAKWRLFGFSPFYGKGAMQVEGYLNKVVKSQWLHPGKAASHDFQESLAAWCVLCEDVYIYEKSFSNKLAELKRVVQWDWGDLETVRRFLFKKFEPGRRAHLFVLLRRLICSPIYELWLLGMILAWELSQKTTFSLASLEKPVLLSWLFISLVGSGIIFPKFLGPLLLRIKGKLYKDPVVEIDKSFSQILKEGILETVVSNLIHKLDLIYRPPALIKNFFAQIKNRPFIWKTGAMGELETVDISLWRTYRCLSSSTVVGLVLLLGCITGFFSKLVCFVLSIYIASFLLGPFMIWYTNKPISSRFYGRRWSNV